MLKHGRVSVMSYGWPNIDESFDPCKDAGFLPIGHRVLHRGL